MPSHVCMWYPWQELNPHLMVRSHTFYPLNYRGMNIYKIVTIRMNTTAHVSMNENNIECTNVQLLRSLCRFILSIISLGLGFIFGLTISTVSSVYVLSILMLIFNS